MGLRIGQEHFIPSVIGQDYQVRTLQIGGLFRAEGRLLHAAEECNHASAAWAEFADSSKETAGLVSVNYAARVNFLRVRGRDQVIPSSGLVGRIFRSATAYFIILSSGVIAMAPEKSPVVIGGPAVLVAVAIGVTVSEPPLAT